MSGEWPVCSAVSGVACLFGHFPMGKMWSPSSCGARVPSFQGSAEHTRWPQGQPFPSEGWGSSHDAYRGKDPPSLLWPRQGPSGCRETGLDVNPRPSQDGLISMALMTYYNLSPIHGVTKSQTWLSDWTELNWIFHPDFLRACCPQGAGPESSV